MLRDVRELPARAEVSVESESHKPRSRRATSRSSGAVEAAANEAQGVIVAPLATAAMLDSSTFAKINADGCAIPETWEDRARKAWESR